MDGVFVVCLSGNVKYPSPSEVMSECYILNRITAFRETYNMLDYTKYYLGLLFLYAHIAAC